MIKSLPQFGLTRSAIVVLGLVVFCAAGHVAFPARISQGIARQVQRPLATVVVGGMFIRPLLLPVVAAALRKIFLSRDAAHFRTVGEPIAVIQGNSDG